MVLLLALLSCCCLGAVDAFTWKACDVDKVPFVPDNVLLVPDPPAAGGQVTFNIQGNAGGWCCTGVGRSAVLLCKDQH